MIRLTHLTLIAFILTLLLACNQNSQTKNSNSDLSHNKTEAEQLYRNKCLICHDTGNADAKPLAPSMHLVKSRYKMVYNTKADFVKAILDFTENPTENKVLMTKAKEKFNIMPKLAYDRKSLQIIATYIFENELPQIETPNNRKIEQNTNISSINTTTQNTELELHNKCVICHQKSNSQSKQLAPLISEFTSVYKQKYKNKTDFVNAITDFVSAPDTKKVLLHDALNQYNIMPKLAYDRKTVKEIASYLYDNSEKNIKKKMAEISQKVESADLKPKDVYNNRCKICHNETFTASKMLAPPMINIKRKYSRVYPDKRAFIDGIVNFTKTPTPDKALMYGALKRFEIMPNLNYSEKELKLAAEYIYDTEFKKPKWFR